MLTHVVINSVLLVLDVWNRKRRERIQGASRSARAQVEVKAVASGLHLFGVERLENANSSTTFGRVAHDRLARGVLYLAQWDLMELI